MIDLPPDQRLARIVAAAKTYSVAFPAKVQQAIQASLDLPTVELSRKQTIDGLIAALDDPKSFAKKPDAILVEHAMALAAKDIVAGGLSNALARYKFRRVLDHREEIIDLFRQAMRPDMEALTAYAEKVPFGTVQDASLVPSLVAPVVDGEATAQRLLSAAAALTALYSTSASGTQARAALVEIPGDVEGARLWDLRLALEGQRRGKHLGGRYPAIWWSGVLDFGATFRLVGVEEWRSNIRRLEAAKPPRMTSASA